MKLTVNRVMSYEPCYTRDKVETLFAGRKVISLHDVYEMDIPNTDKIWILTRPNVLNSKIRDKWLEIIVTIAINTAKQFCNNSEWNKWADNWLNGTDRSYAAAYNAANAAYAANAACAAANNANAVAEYKQQVEDILSMLDKGE